MTELTFNGALASIWARPNAPVWVLQTDVCRTKVALRIVKVDGFYVVFQVTALHFTPLDSPYLDSMTVTFTLSNKDPRSAQP